MQGLCLSPSLGLNVQRNADAYRNATAPVAAGERCSLLATQPPRRSRDNKASMKAEFKVHTRGVRQTKVSAALTGHRPCPLKAFSGQGRSRPFPIMENPIRPSTVHGVQTHSMQTPLGTIEDACHSNSICMMQCDSNLGRRRSCSVSAFGKGQQLPLSLSFEK